MFKFVGQNIMRIRRDINCDVQNPSPNEVPIFSLTSDNLVVCFFSNLGHIYSVVNIQP